MYFITNQNGNIVAANKDFLEEIGSKDICSISTLLTSKQIILNEENSKVSFINSNSDFKYNKSTLYSPFGDLNLYQLFDTTKIDSNIDDSDIEYLKKIKEGKIDTQDKNFNIPEITNKDNIIENIEESIKVDKNIEDSNQPEQLIYNLNKDLELTKDTEATKKITPTLETIEENLENTQNTKIVENKNIEIENEIDKIEEKIVNIETNNIDEIEEENRGGLDFLKSKLFPWGGSKKSDDSKNIEIEEESLITPAKDLIDIEKDKEKKEDNSLIQIDNKELEKEIIYEKIDKKIEDKEELESLEKSLTNTEDKYKNNEPLEIKNEELNLFKDIEPKPKESKDNLTLEEEELLILKETTSIKKDIDIKQDIEVKIDDIKPIETKIIEVEEVKNVTKSEDKEKENKKEDTLLNKLIELQAKKIDFKEKAENISIDVENYKLLLGNFLDELDNYRDDLENGDRTTIDMLIDASTLLDLEVITKKLQSINSNYNKKLLLKELYLLKGILQNRLKSKEEIEELTVEEKKPTIAKVEESIKDSSENIITTTIEEESNRQKQIEEINSEERVYKELFEEDTPPKIPTEAIEIKDANQLYSAIDSVETDFDVDKPSTELNLPRSLILEFVNDFVAQAKDHIPNIVNAYTQRDIKTIQTTAHMLKGAASNLRLDKIAEILFSIQKENNLDNSGELFKKFIAHLKGLEYQLKNIESEKNED